MMKILIREYSIGYGSQKSREKRLELTTLERDINILDIALEKHYCKVFEMKREELKSKLSKILLDKAKGEQIRARAKYIEEGERSTSYFLNLEKQQ